MGDGYWGCLWDERGRGMVAKYEPADADKILHKDDWNHYYVRAEGHHIQAWLNGVKTIDVNDEPGNLTGPLGYPAHSRRKTLGSVVQEPLSAANPDETSVDRR